MIVLLLFIILLLLLLAFIIIIFCEKKVGFTKLYSKKLLIQYIDNIVKKRKTYIKLCKNDTNLRKLHINYNKKRIKFNSLKFDKNCFFDVSREHLYLFPRQVFFENKNHLSFNCRKFCSKFKHIKFRTYKGKIIINEIAKSYAYLSVYSNFDMVAHFRDLSKKYVFYKKEIDILPILVKYYLLKIALIESRKLYCLEKDIIFDNNILFNKVSHNLNCASLYSIYFFNKNICHIPSEEKTAYSVSNELGLELLDIYYTAKKCFLWLDII